LIAAGTSAATAAFDPAAGVEVDPELVPDADPELEEEDEDELLLPHPATAAMPSINTPARNHLTI
jgi:hypothetical protein